MIIAIDGPAGSGKSTISRLISERHGATYLDTGAMYRALTWLALERGVATDDGAMLFALASEYPIDLLPDNRVLIDGHDVTSEIRSPKIDANVSAVSAHKQVREIMVDRQRELALSQDVVIEGRDTTTVVFPNADIKVFLTASAAQRAARRALQYQNQGRDDVDVAAVQEQLESRDALDSNRAHAPLVQAADALVIDTSDLGIDEVLRVIEDRIAALKQ